jgi:hypothetical protein
MGLETMDLDGLGIKFQALFLVGEELLDILALISLKLNHLPHLSIDDDGAIASCNPSLAAPDEIRHLGWSNVPNFFLMTLRIFFWSNFLGRPWTVVKVFRPLRSIY